VVFTTVFGICGMLWVAMVGVIAWFDAAGLLSVLFPTGIVRAIYRSNMSSSGSFSSSMLIYYTGSISGTCTILGGGVVMVGICYIVGSCGVADADICIYLMARAHLDRPSTSSTSFSLFLWRSTVLASS
jgi:hypothetical protein